MNFPLWAGKQLKFSVHYYRHLKQEIILRGLYVSIMFVFAVFLEQLRLNKMLKTAEWL